METFVDKNMEVPGKIERDDIVWYDASKAPVTIHGAAEGFFRLPSDFPILDGFKRQSTGVRVRFVTNSPFVAIRAFYEGDFTPTIMPPSSVWGFDLYKRRDDGSEVFVGGFRPPANALDGYESLLYTSGENCYTINFPLLKGVTELYVGVKEGSSIKEPPVYNYLGNPIVFYGSSITHGAAASRPGNTYCAMIAQKLGVDHINLGFSGNAKGEKEIARYISQLKMSAFVLDYHHNAYDLKHLHDTHYNFYKTVRLKNPFIPIVIVTAPSVNPDDTWVSGGVKIIQETYRRAKEEGDKYVYFVDGCHLFDGEWKESCTVDGTHPNDLGFMRMAKVIGRTLTSALENGFKL
ncbi:MAG: hypothetical protein IJ946_04820 [Clostridia bacterium]|nr:hypothetical protein [Clostridia bacterium]